MQENEIRAALDAQTKALQQQSGHILALTAILMASVEVSKVDMKQVRLILKSMYGSMYAIDPNLPNYPGSPLSQQQSVAERIAEEIVGVAEKNSKLQLG